MPSLGGAARGAATGAGIGSFVPGIGTGVGAGVGALAGLLFGRGGKKKEDDQEEEQPFLDSIKGVSERLKGTGQQLTGMSSEALAPVLEQLRNVLSSDPGAVMDATRQERGRVIDQYDTARRAISQFGPRGGGTTSALAESRFAQAESLADVTSAARRDAIGSAAQLGTSLAGLGLSAAQLESADLNMIVNAILARQELQLQQRGQNLAVAGDVGETIGSIIGAILTRKKAA